MRIGLVIYGSLDTLSGGYLYDRRLVEYLRAQGDTVEIISLPWRNYAVHLTDNLHLRLPPGLDLLIQDELNHPSLLTANSTPRAYPVISLVHHLRSSELRPAWLNRIYRLIEKRYVISVDGFIFNSKTTMKVVNCLMESSKPGIVAYPPTDRFGSPMSQDQVIARAKDNGPLRIIFLGNVIRRKGLHTLLDAIMDAPNVQLDIIGGLEIEKGYAADMQWAVADFPQKERISFHGPLDQEVLIEKMKSAHVLVVPSSYEGFGIVYLEGMAFGLSAIGTNAGAASEIITDGENGFLISPGDTKTLADRIFTLVNNRDQLVSMSIAALKRYHRQPSWDETAGQIREFLQRMIAKNSHSPSGIN